MLIALDVVFLQQREELLLKIHFSVVRFLFLDGELIARKEVRRTPVRRYAKGAQLTD